MEFLDFFNYSFFNRALFMAVFGGISCGIAGVWILLLNISFIGVAMAHAALAGAVIGIFLGINPIILSFIFCILTAVLIEPLSKKAKLHGNVSINIMFSFMLALALLFAGLMKNYQVEILGFLWGSILTVTNREIILNFIMIIVLLGFIKFFHKALMAVFFDREIANLLGVPEKQIIYIIMILISVTISFNLSSIGGLLIYSLIALPSAAAYQLTDKIKNMYILSSVFAVTGSVVGLLISSFVELPVAATIIIVLCVIFCITTVFSIKK